MKCSKACAPANSCGSVLELQPPEAGIPAAQSDAGIEPFDPNGDALHHAVLAPLTQFIVDAVGPFQVGRVGVLLRDETGGVAGGAWGNTVFGWLQVDGMVVAESHRGQGLGARLLQALERQAIDQGCHSAWVDTFEFQARGFYEKMGYDCFGVLDNFPIGYKRFYLSKRLTQATPGLAA